MVKLMDSRFGLVATIASIAVAVFALVGATYALVCPTVGGSTDPDEESEDEPPTEVRDCGSNPSTVKRYLLDAGYDNNAASGIMGNLAHESGYTPNKLNKGRNSQTCLVNDSFRLFTNETRTSIAKRYSSEYGPCTIKASGAFGLAQWLGERIERGLQQTADSMGKPVTNLDVQATFLVKQLNTDLFGSYYKKYFSVEKLNGHTLAEVTYAFYRYVEAPGSAICVGVNGDGRNRGCGNGTVNNKLPPYLFNVSALNQTDHALAYSSFKGRYNTAKNAAALDVSQCATDGTQDSSDEETEAPEGGEDAPEGGSEVPTEVPVVTPQPQQPESYSENEALGKQSVSNAISQTDGRIKSTPWLTRSFDKKIGVYDDGDCCGSGCSLVAVGNAYGAIHNYSQSEVVSFINNLASWTKTAINSPSAASTRTMIRHVSDMTLMQQAWTSKSTSDSSKIASIRSALASGGAVVAGGDRSGTDTDFCEAGSSHLGDGECVFTPGGHWVAIIGITADNKLVIANPAKSNGRNWIFPASHVLKYSNYGYIVK